MFIAEAASPFIFCRYLPMRRNGGVPTAVDGEMIWSSSQIHLLE
jgi:hypothetical protein